MSRDPQRYLELNHFSQVYCCRQYDLLFGIILLSACLSVCDAMHCGTQGQCGNQGQCRGLKSVLFFQQALPLQLFRIFCSSIYRLAKKRSDWQKTWQEPKADFSSKLQISKYSCWSWLFQTIVYSRTSHIHCVSKKTRQLWNGIAQNYNDRF